MTLIEELLDLEFPNAIEISPNAQHVLYSTTLPLGHKKGEHQCSTIWLAETGRPESARQLTDGLANDRVPKWCPDGNSIIFISDRAKQGQSCSIYKLPVQTGGDAYPLTPVENERSIELAVWNLDGSSIAYISADESSPQKKAKEKDKNDANVWGEDWAFNCLRVLHVATTEVTTLVNRNSHVLDLAWNDEGTRIAFTDTRTPHIESRYQYGTNISIADVSSKQIQAICSFPNFIQDLTWTADRVYFVGPVTPEAVLSARAVYQIDITGKSASYEKYAHGEEDCASGLRKADEDVTVLVQRGLETQIRMLKGRALFGKPTSIDVWDAAFTTDSDEMIVAVALGNTNSPPEVFTTTASGGAMVQLSNHGETCRSRKFGTPYFISCPAASLNEEEDRLDGVYIAPHNSHIASEDKPDQPLPTVVLVHGGPYSRSTIQFNPLYHMWSEVLLDAGFGILLVNYRGSSGRGEKFAAYALGRGGTYEYSDIITLTQCAIEKGFADKDRLVVGGWSWGGFLSYLCSMRNGLHEHGWTFKAAIPGAASSDQDTMIFTSDIGVAQGKLAGRAPWEAEKNDTSGREGSPIWEFKAALEKGGVIPPMLILHGESDKRVPIEQSVAFRRALESAGLPFELVTYPREPHMFNERNHIVDMAERVVRFVKMHIGGN